jgi:hypothetical protein
MLPPIPKTVTNTRVEVSPWDLHSERVVDCALCSLGHLANTAPSVGLDLDDRLHSPQVVVSQPIDLRFSAHSASMLAYLHGVEQEHR